MATFCTRLQVLVALVGLLGIWGCTPAGNAPSLQVSPAAVSFSSTQAVRTITISNGGGGTLTWSIEEVTRENADAPWVPADVSWLSVSQSAGSTENDDSPVQLSVDRTGLAPGSYSNTGIRITSNGGELVVPVSMTVETTLFASTTIISLNPDDLSLTFQIRNQGSEPAAWELFFVPEPGNRDSATTFPVDFSISPGTVGTTDAGGTTTVTLSWLVARDNFDILVVSNSGDILISVRFDAVISNLNVTPNPITVYVSLDPSITNQPTSFLTLQNTGFTSLGVALEAVDSSDPFAVPPLSLGTTTLTVAPGTSERIGVQVSDVELVQIGSGVYEIELRSGAEIMRVPVIVEITELPIIEVSSPPSPELSQPSVTPISVLNFGTTSFQETFYVTNVGPPGSELYFRARVVQGGQNEPPVPAQPIVLGINPSQGDTTASGNTFFLQSQNRFIFGLPVTVTIDRSALTDDLHVIEIEILATNANFSQVNEAIAPRRIQLRIERPPLMVEGALNRSRPPFMGRWVLLVRDRFGNAVPAQTPDDFEKITFRVFEDGVPLNLDETTQFVTKPRDFNLAVVLDYTGSMYNAGTTSATDPLQRGEAIQNMIEATKELINDLPPNTRIGLFYHHDRSQQNFIMHQFTTDKASLINRLDTFTVPTGLYGSSKINDAVATAIAAVIAEDPADALPFDETDVRAVLFVTDGEDNSSILDSGNVANLARDFQVRLYPVAYDPSPNGPTTAELLNLAFDTGGHFYNAGKDAENLDKILGNAAGLTFRESLPTINPNTIAFTLENPTEQVLTYSVNFDASLLWLVSVLPDSSSILPGAERNITITVNSSQAVLPANTTVEAPINISSNLGKGTVLVTLTTDGAGGVADLRLTLLDQPGRFWDDLQNQFMLTYNTPQQQSTSYSIQVLYEQPNGEVISGAFAENGLFFIGDPLGGQISLTTKGIDSQNRAEVFVRADYVPRNVSRFRMRFYTELPLNTPQAAVAAFANIQMTVDLAPGGLLMPQDTNAQPWALINEGDGIFLALTTQENFLPFSSFGNLLRLTFTNLEPFIAAFDGIPQQPEFFVQMRVDNGIYFAPAGTTQPADSKFFLYPSGLLNENRPVKVGVRPDLAGPARDFFDLNQPVIMNPEAPFAFDIDQDGISDFSDPSPFNPDLPSAISRPTLLDMTVPNSADNAGPFTTPADPANPGANETLPALFVRNNRLDTFTWQIDTAALPAWLSVDVSGGTLAPGEEVRVRLTVSNAGLAASILLDTISLMFDFPEFEDEFVTVSLTVLPPQN